MSVPRHRLRAGLAVSIALSLTACTGASEERRSPDAVLAAAKKNLDETPGVHIALSAEKLPSGVNGILNADGIGTHPPAFEGSLKVWADGITADVAVIAVNDVVHAKLPFTTSYSAINPEDYGAPNPARLLGTDEGLSSLLTEAEEVEVGERERDGELVLTRYTGRVSGEVVSSIIPSARADSTFDAGFAITEDDLLHEAVVTGPFYPDAADVTYTIQFDQYGTEKDITAP